jgi:hypothetical protein
MKLIKETKYFLDSTQMKESHEIITFRLLCALFFRWNNRLIDKSFFEKIA